MNVVEIIPEGYDNAITRSDLVMRSGENDREIRSQIETAVKEGTIIINLGDGRGYFKPIPGKEDYLVRKALRMNESRLREIATKSIMLERYLE